MRTKIEWSVYRSAINTGGTNNAPTHIMELRIRLLQGYDGEPNRVRVTLQRLDVVSVAEGLWLFTLDAAERGDLRWYLEEYPRYPSSGFDARATRAETWLHRRGAELFDSVFACERRLALYDAVAPRLADTRIVIETAQDDFAAMSLPWEMLRDGRDGGGTLARDAGAFVRSQPDLPDVRPTESANSLNILLVISRPGGVDDIPFFAVVRPLLNLARENGSRVRVDVLRPPTLALLGRVLADNPGFYHVVHFDGHGTFAPGGEHGVYHAAAREGYLSFEDRSGNAAYTSGMEVRHALMRGGGVPVMVLNVCQSGMA